MKTGIFLDGRVFGFQRHGGISRMHYELLRHLHPAFRIELFRGFYQDNYDWQALRLEGNAGSKWDVAFRGSGRLKLLLEKPWLEYRWSKAFNKGISLYHASYYRVPRSQPGVKLLVVDYDSIHERFPEYFRGTARMKEIKRRAFQQADLIVSISESSRQDVIRFYHVPEEKIKVLHLGINEFFDVAPGTRPEDSGRPYLLYVGSRVAYKNFEILVRAFETGLFPELDLRVVGGETPLESGRQLGGKCSIYWEAADDLRLRELYWDAQALVYPSRYEGFGLPPLEALASGCPVVAGDTPALREVLGSNAEFFCCDHSVELVAAVDRAMSWSGDKRRAAYLHAKGFSWSRAASHLAEYYQGLLSA